MKIDDADNRRMAVFYCQKSMKERIYGDTEPAHIVVANKALEAHKARYGEGNKHHHITYSIAYRGKHYQVEVITRRTTIAATVITGTRNLSRLPEFA